MLKNNNLIRFIMTTSATFASLSIAIFSIIISLTQWYPQILKITHFFELFTLLRLSAYTFLGICFLTILCEGEIIDRRYIVSAYGKLPFIYLFGILLLIFVVMRIAWILGYIF